LMPHIFHYLYHNAKPDISYHGYAKYCQFTLWNTVNEPLKPTTDFTLEHVRRLKRRRMQAGVVRIYFLDGSEMDLFVQPHTRVCDSLVEIFNRIELKDRPGFGIFQVGREQENEAGEGREIWVPLNSCLLDYDPQPRPSVSPVLYKQQQARLVFKRRLYQDLTSNDKLAQKLLYYQTLVSICDEGLPCSEKQMLKFLALHRIVDAQLKSAPVANANMLTAVAVKGILPHFVEGYSEKKKEKYMEKISQAKANFKVNQKIEHDILINEVREWNLFGCSYFTCKYLAEDKTRAIPSNLMMGISSQGVYLVHGRDRKVFEDYQFFRIVGWELKDNEYFNLIVRDQTVKNRTNTYRFKTVEAEEIVALMTTLQDDINRVTEKE